MLLVLRDRRFDVTHRALVVATPDRLDHDLLDAFVAAGVDAFAVRSSSARDAVCDRVDVPVGVVVSPGHVEFEPRQPLSAAGPFDASGPERMAAVAASVQWGDRLLLCSKVDDVRADRRVAEVMARILAARSAAPNPPAREAAS